MSFGKIIGVITGICGVVLLIGYEAMFSGSNELLGIFAVLSAATSYAFAGVWGKRFKTLRIKPIITATGQLLCSSAVLLPSLYGNCGSPLEY